MKRIWIAVVFLAISVSFCITEQFFINTSYSQIVNYIDQGDSDKLLEYWGKRNDMLYAFTDHKMLDSLSDSINSLKDTDEKEKTMIEIKAKAKTFYENQRITFSNIF